MRQSYAEIDESRNRSAFQAFDIVMDIERHFILGPEERMTRPNSWSDFSPAHAGVAAALRRAFVLPSDECDRQFEELLRKLC